MNVITVLLYLISMYLMCTAFQSPGKDKYLAEINELLAVHFPSAPLLPGNPTEAQLKNIMDGLLMREQLMSLINKPEEGSELPIPEDVVLGVLMESRDLKDAILEEDPSALPEINETFDATAPEETRDPAPEGPAQ